MAAHAPPSPPANGTAALGAHQSLSTPTLKCAAPATPTVPAPCASVINNCSPIPFGESDGLITSGQKNANTFGEAQIDIRYFFAGNSCTSFGSAMLKSRSAASFTSALKDLVAPVGINLTNCANVTIRKETTPDGDTQKFDYTSSLDTSGTDNPSFSLADGESKSFRQRDLRRILLGDRDRPRRMCSRTSSATLPNTRAAE